MRVALLSDSHNNWQALKDAVSIASAEDCDVAFFAGDLTRLKGADLLAQFSGPVHMIIGNMDHDVDGIWAKAEDTDNVIYHGDVCDIERDGLRVFMQHRPDNVEKRAREDIYDLCLHGHLHEFRHETIGSTHLINPGALTRRSRKPTWALFDTETDELERFYP